MTSLLKKFVADCFKTSSGRPEDWTVSGPCHLYNIGLQVWTIGFDVIWVRWVCKAPYVYATQWQGGSVFSAIVSRFYGSEHSSVCGCYLKYALYELSNWASAFENNEEPISKCSLASSDRYSNRGCGNLGWTPVSCLQRAPLKIGKYIKNIKVQLLVGHCFAVLMGH